MEHIIEDEVTDLARVKLLFESLPFIPPDIPVARPVHELTHHEQQAGPPTIDASPSFNAEEFQNNVGPSQGPSTGQGLSGSDIGVAVAFEPLDGNPQAE
jgi:hypothetical protein